MISRFSIIASMVKLESDKDKDLEKNVKQLIMTLVEVAERMSRVGQAVGTFTTWASARSAGWNRTGSTRYLLK